MPRYGDPPEDAEYGDDRPLRMEILHEGRVLCVFCERWGRGGHVVLDILDTEGEPVRLGEDEPFMVGSMCYTCMSVNPELVEAYREAKAEQAELRKEVKH